MSANTDEPIFREDVDDEIRFAAQETEYIESSWKTAYDWYQRLKAQGAPQPLLEKVAAIVTNFSEATKRFEAISADLQSIRDCFPPIPPDR